jgi:integrase/recombinase XerD
MAKKGWIKKDSELQGFAERNIRIANKGAYKNLMLQVNKAARHAKGSSLTSQRQYYHHMDQFVRFTADRFALKNLANLSGKHLAAYIEDRQHAGKSASSIKLDLVAIRYFHDHLPKTRHDLPDNQKLKDHYGLSLERRIFGRVNRRWTDSEYKKMVNLTYRLQHPETGHILQLCREQGLRIHEAVRLSRKDAEMAFKTNSLRIKGKGGLVRKVPLEPSVRNILHACMRGVARNHKLFVRDEQKAHQVIQATQDFIHNHRDKVADPAARAPGVQLTVHGLRHSYAYEKYQKLIEKGMDPKTARYRVSELIGHSREDVTKIYLTE